MTRPDSLNFNPLSAQFSDALDQAIRKAGDTLGDALADDKTHAPSALIDAVLANLSYHVTQKIALRLKQQRPSQ